MSDDNKNVFTYVGDPHDDFSGPTNLDVFGLSFKKGVAVTVDDENVARKLRGHSHFANGDEAVEAVEHDRDELVELKVEELRAIAENEEVDLPAGNIKKADLIRLIREHREAQD